MASGSCSGDKEPLKCCLENWAELQGIRLQISNMQRDYLRGATQISFYKIKTRWHLHNKKQTLYFKWHHISWGNIWQYKYLVNIKYCTWLINPCKGHNPLIRGETNSTVWFQQQAHVKPCCWQLIVLQHKGTLCVPSRKLLCQSTGARLKTKKKNVQMTRTLRY